MVKVYLLKCILPIPEKDRLLLFSVLDSHEMKLIATHLWQVLDMQINNITCLH